MAKIFPINVRRTTTIVVSGGVVITEKAIYELPEIHPGPTELAGNAIASLEAGPDPTEDVGVIAAVSIVETAPDATILQRLLARIFEAAPPATPLETVGIGDLETPQQAHDEVALDAGIFETAPGATCLAGAEAGIFESAPGASELGGLGGGALESPDEPSDLVGVSTGTGLYETHPDPTELAIAPTLAIEQTAHPDAAEMPGAGAKAYESSPMPTESLDAIDARALETPPEPSETVLINGAVGIAEAHASPTAVYGVRPNAAESFPASSDATRSTSVHRGGSNAASAIAGTVNTTRNDWTNPTNAQGKHNGAYASVTGNLLGARGGRVRCQYADFGTNMSGLTLDAVYLHYYWYASSVLSTINILLDYRLGTSGAWTNVHSQDVTLSTVDNMTTPTTIDMTATLDTWTKLNQLETSIEAAIAALALNDTARLDGVELEINAHYDA